MVGSRQARLARSPPAAGREGPRAGQRNEDNPERGVRRGLDADRHETDDLLVRLSLKVPIDEVSIEVGAGLSEEVEGPRGLPAEAGPADPEDATQKILSGALGQPACGLKGHASLTLILSLLDCQRLARPGRRRSEK